MQMMRERLYIVHKSYWLLCASNCQCDGIKSIGVRNIGKNTGHVRVRLPVGILVHWRYDLSHSIEQVFPIR